MAAKLTAQLSNFKVVRQSIATLPPNDRKKLSFMAAVQVILGGLDLIGVALVGALGALAVNGVQSRQPGDRVNFLLSNLHISELRFQQQFAVIGLLAASALIGRTFLSVIFTRRTLFFLAIRGARMSSNLIEKLLQQPLLAIQSRTNQENVFAVTSGVNAITMGILGAAVTVIADFSLLLIIITGLLILNPSVAIGTLLMFSTIAFILYKTLHNRAQKLGINEAKVGIATNQKIIEALNSYRQMFVSNRREYYSKEISKLRTEAAEIMAETTFMPNIGKYVIETAVILGALLLGAIQFWTQDATNAVATLTVFMAAGSRLAPAVLRLQQGSIVIKGAVGQASLTLELIQEFSKGNSESSSISRFDPIHEGFNGAVTVKEVSFTYPGMGAHAVKNISLDAKQGQVLAIVGPSGAG